MIAACAADLVARVQSVGALAARCSLSLGGHSVDPGLLKIPLPAAWVIFGGDKEADSQADIRREGMVPDTQEMSGLWRVVVYVPYTNDADLIATQFPLLAAVIGAVKRSETGGPLGGMEAPNGYRWRYTGQKLSLVYNDRLAYEQHYTLDMVL